MKQTRGGPRSVAITLLAALLAGCSPTPGTLELQILSNGEATPARVELLPAEGDADDAPVPDDALPVVIECGLAPLPAWLEQTNRSRRIHNPYTGTDQFYLAGHTTMDLAPGAYTLRVYKGPEYRVSRHRIEIRSGEREQVSVEMERWIDPASEGWYGADDHIHITRLQAADNPWISTWMRAEGLRVANLLQMGTAEQFGVTPQYAFGDAGVYSSGGADATTLVTGQEHPRTHLLGHTITLGAREAIDLRDTYIVFEGFWRESERLGGVSGFAHFGLGPANDGLAVSAPGGRIRFVEVLQFEYAQYRAWYELLDMGFRVAPSAGTDFPCGPSIPGRERVYVQVDGELDRASFVEGVRAGRTFVSNGPVLSLEASAANGEPVGVGGEIALPSPGTIHVRGSARFDPESDHLDALELVQGGQVVRVETAATEPGRITLDAEIPIDGSTWIALRTAGHKLDEAPYVPIDIPEWVNAAIRRIGGGWSFEGRAEYDAGLTHRPTAAHTAAIRLHVAGTTPASAEVARRWLARLDDLEARIGEDRIDEVEVWAGFPYSDGVSLEHVRRNRPALLDAIASARQHYEDLAGPGDAP